MLVGLGQLGPLQLNNVEPLLEHSALVGECALKGAGSAGFCFCVSCLPRLDLFKRVDNGIEG